MQLIAIEGKRNILDQKHMKLTIPISGPFIKYVIIKF